VNGRRPVDARRPAPKRPAEQLSPPAEVLQAMFPWMRRADAVFMAERLADETEE
jgi:hypothetical protein